MTERGHGQIESETPLFDAQLALSKAVEALQKLPARSLSAQNRALFLLYLNQGVEAIKQAADPSSPEGGPSDVR